MSKRELAKQTLGEQAFQEEGQTGANVSKWEFAWYDFGIAKSQCGWKEVSQEDNSFTQKDSRTLIHYLVFT